MKNNKIAGRGKFYGRKFAIAAAKKHDDRSMRFLLFVSCRASEAALRLAYSPHKVNELGLG